MWSGEGAVDGEKLLGGARSPPYPASIPPSHPLLPGSMFLPRVAPHGCRPHTVPVPSALPSPRAVAARCRGPSHPPGPGGAAPPGGGPAPAERGFPPPPPSPSCSSALLFSLPSLPPSARGSRRPSALLHPSLHPSLLLLAVPPAPLPGADVTHPLKARAIMAAAAATVPLASS